MFFLFKYALNKYDSKKKKSKGRLNLCSEKKNKIDIYLQCQSE